jgi:hypothetical protein
VCGMFCAEFEIGCLVLFLNVCGAEFGAIYVCTIWFACLFGGKLRLLQKCFLLPYRFDRKQCVCVFDWIFRGRAAWWAAASHAGRMGGGTAPPRRPPGGPSESTQEAPRRLPGGPQDARRRPPGSPQEAPQVPRRPPGGPQETPGRLPNLL